MKGLWRSTEKRYPISAPRLKIGESSLVCVTRFVILGDASNGWRVHTTQRVSLTVQLVAGEKPQRGMLYRPRVVTECGGAGMVMVDVVAEIAGDSNYSIAGWYQTGDTWFGGEIRW